MQQRQVTYPRKAIAKVLRIAEKRQLLPNDQSPNISLLRSLTGSARPVRNSNNPDALHQHIGGFWEVLYHISHFWPLQQVGVELLMFASGLVSSIFRESHNTRGSEFTVYTRIGIFLRLVITGLAASRLPKTR